MLNAGVLKFTSGVIQTVTSADPVYFNGGTPVDASGRLFISESLPDFFLGGLGYKANLALCVATSGAITHSVAGFGLNADGAIVVSPGPIEFYSSGLPFDSLGRLVMNANFVPSFLITQSGAFIITQSGLNIRVTQ
jgi:hypothetical protein